MEIDNIEETYNHNIKDILKETLESLDLQTQVEMLNSKLADQSLSEVDKEYLHELLNTAKANIEENDVTGNDTNYVLKLFARSSKICGTGIAS